MATITGTISDDSFVLAPGNLYLGLRGIDTFTYSGGNATVDGGEGGERYEGNYYTDSRFETDAIFVESNADTFVRFNSTEDGFIRSASGTLQFNHVEGIHLGSGNDVVRAGGASVSEYGLLIWTGDGNDNIVGSRGDDFIDGGTGNDTIFAGLGNDHIQSSEGNDLIYGGAGDENIRWGLGDAFWHNPGNDTIYGGEGHDLINVWVWEHGNGEGSRGGSVQINSTRADGAFAGVAKVGTEAGTSTLRFQGMEQGWTHMGNDTIDGSKAKVTGDIGFHWGARWGDDILIGSSGNDTLEGGEGRDTITGGAGNDLLSANGDFYDWNAPADAEQDTFIFNRGFGHDTIVGFASNDVLDIRDGMTYTAVEQDRGTLITFNTGDTIMLANYFDFI